MLHSKSVALLVAASVAAVSFAGAAGAQDYPTASVSLAKVDFNNPDEVQAVYNKLRRTAADLCDSRVLGASHKFLNDRECAAMALDQAVIDSRQPALHAYHADKLNTQQVMMAKKAAAKDKQYAAK
ncbi:UrcA family protein [Asticcacaulis sp. BYS171W]|uniref:UrcA family protein n=1 Tax=Asticcacaulis aquaticus TaxID=2984212 RepID=A0ABT5HPS5_9CAUL|nr:UrcA family protein [Asticcacaulis aquaticus]MDC7682068.1 UrcA family protein [Asticcacaulis aquaticus]